ncbi:MAG: retroviral-like aspartic protease family protein [Defluviitaleaceae bacterium]|nr:retroviral-like aspartic protease family protein [Defluviitaleaceae bacterium]MCL2261750.1 retroviral-like aspartic protease family protein [Defluviitaleaceae bacterium]
MSSFSVELNKKRICRYVFASHLWDTRVNGFGEAVSVLLDTGSFNTVIHESLVEHRGFMHDVTMRVSVAGFSGDARICELHKLKIGNREFEKVVALVVPFDGELKNHILLGANVTNNWKFTVSREENLLNVTEQFSTAARERKYPYRYCFNSKGNIMAFQEFDHQGDNLHEQNA